MKLLVTGGAGYIGSVVAARLVDDGHAVTVLDDLSTGHRDAIPDGAAFVEGSVDDAASVLSAGVDAVLHFAAKSLVAESMTRPELYWWNNVVGTLRLLGAMRDTGVRRLVFSSTAATYGIPETTPITEDAPARPINPYGHSKLAIDHALADEAAAHGLRAVSLRYFNVGGAVERYGERHDPETHLIPNVLQVAAGIRDSVDIYGSDYPTPDGTAIRDYLHVDDLARAHVLALDRTGGDPAAGSGGPAAGGEHRVYNLGSGTGFSVAEVVDAARRVTGHAIPAVQRPRRAGDPPVLVASSARIAAELAWRTEHSLDRIVADAWAFTRRGAATAGR